MLSPVSHVDGLAARSLAADIHAFTPVGILGVVKEHNADGSCVISLDKVKVQLRALYLLSKLSFCGLRRRIVTDGMAAMSLDIFILMLTVIGLRHQICFAQRSSRVASILFQQGVLYALVSAMTSIPMAVSV